MSVIINELEVAMPDAAAPAPEVPGAQAPAPAAGPTPMELREIMRHLDERRDRVAAD